MNIPEQTKKYRSEQQLTLQAFGEVLLERVPDRTLSKQAVHLWEVGVQNPALDLLIQVASLYTDWRTCWAQDCLHVLMPDVFTPASVTHGGVNITAVLNSEPIGMESGCADGNSTKTPTQSRAMGTR